MIEQPRQRRPSLLFAVLDAGEIGGVGAQQVVHAVPARTCGLHQVRPGQQVEQVLGLLASGVDERGDGVAIEVGAGVQPDQPKRPRRLGG